MPEDAEFDYQQARQDSVSIIGSVIAAGLMFWVTPGDPYERTTMGILWGMLAFIVINSAFESDVKISDIVRESKKFGSEMKEALVKWFRKRYFD